MEEWKLLKEGWSVLTGIGVSVWIIYYYSRPSEHECARCKITINHKADRFKADIQGQTRYICHNCQSQLNEIGLIVDRNSGLWTQQCQYCKKPFNRHDRRNYIDVRGELFVVCNICVPSIGQNANTPMEGKLSELLSAEFLSKCSAHTDWQVFIGESGLLPFTQTTMQSQEWNDYVRRTTSFNSWDELFKAASIWTRDNHLLRILRQ